MINYEEILAELNNTTNKYSCFQFELVVMTDNDNKLVYTIFVNDGCSNFRVYHENLYECETNSDIINAVLQELEDHVNDIGVLYERIGKIEL